jgi:hypothetical protein
MAPDGRLLEVARILAAGVLRLYAGRVTAAPAAGTPTPENLSKSVSNCLEVPAPPVLSVHNG